MSAAATGAPLRLCVLTVLGSGYVPVTPATWGSLTSVALFAGLSGVLTAVGGGRIVVEVATLAGIAVAGWLSVRWGAWAVAHFRSKDPRPFVLDEFAGQWIALLSLPVAPWADGPATLVALFGQFVLFRVFDILKPPPARRLERLPAGWGVLCDDLAAGVYANLAGQALWRLTPLPERLVEPLRGLLAA